MRLNPLLRSLDLILLIGLVFVVIWTFKINNESQAALERVSDLEKQIAAEKAEIDLLRSDWSLLTGPARLQRLVEQYNQELELDVTSASQIATEEELPGFSEHNLLPSDENQAAIDDDTKTGSIDRGSQ